jgi:uncharacterized Fe-S cluster protein YjdI/CDGSH-type Zn-finger protein
MSLKSKIKHYDSPDITVSYDVERCIHAEDCVRSLPAVFDPQKRPWIHPNEAGAEEIAAAVERCPTGALHFTRKDGGRTEATPTANNVAIEPDGPLYVSGNVEITDQQGNVVLKDTRVALCRCGASQNKPLCDNSHVQAAFKDPGIPPDNAS